ncbi:hydroxymethylglutaryl-CoA lyase [Microscilla marina]|uniref:Hydroxymethylglutaryl-CoA lyase like protein n=1 Tax=Microscilla marina ATCC 23134 TaxID=313606 RepID=A1ZRW3_MICM2|nr:hydroxymethylglutaryl-CoA lyase [Microscilla marina]EAY26851.1 hydroxymethylglutaryl-CoA lyase like protein [Microscilla marina ATCC 23134]
MKYIECPRDAMQGLSEFIPTHLKAQYINTLLEVGFDTIDFGSFVSPKAIPQLRDTAEVLNQLKLDNTQSKLLAIIANKRGAEQAVQFNEISYLGFPLSASETFQKRNTNKSIEEAFKLVEEVQHLCQKHNKTLVTYISMGFGNPYGDPYDAETIEKFTQTLVDLDVKIISLADTIGVSNPSNIGFLYQTLIPRFPEVEFGAHLHSTPQTITEKLRAAYEAGCRRFDGALRGFGGCPMAEDDLVGNLATEVVLDFFAKNFESIPVNQQKFKEAYALSGQVFPMH